MGLFDIFKRDKESYLHLFSDDLVTPAQISANLEEVCKRNTPIIAMIDDRPRTFRSIFLEVENESDFVIIDVLMPKDGNRIIEESEKVRIDYTLEGVMYYFETKFVEMVRGRFTSIKLVLPSVIKKIQKRGSFRVSPSIDNPITAELTDLIREDVSDISEGGLSFYTSRTENELPVGVVFERVTFKLPTMDRYIKTKGVIRQFIKGSGVGVKNKCCIEFTDMGMKDRDAIAHYVIVRQREMILRMRGEE
jgi:c-di-GMP-binding flagellar brake protein YcgR